MANKVRKLPAPKNIVTTIIRNPSDWIMQNYDGSLNAPLTEDEMLDDPRELFKNYRPEYDPQYQHLANPRPGNTPEQEALRLKTWDNIKNFEDKYHNLNYDVELYNRKLLEDKLIPTARVRRGV